MCGGGGGGFGRGGFPRRDPLLPHAYLQGGCVSGGYSRAQNMDGLMKGKHAQKNFGAIGTMAPTPLSLKTGGGGGGPCMRHPPSYPSMTTPYNAWSMDRPLSPRVSANSVNPSCSYVPSTTTPSSASCSELSDFVSESVDTLASATDFVSDP